MALSTAEAHKDGEADWDKWTADEAEARLEWAGTQPAFREAMDDPAHPQHQLYLDQVSALHQVMSEGSPAPAAADAVVRPAGDQSEVATLRGDQQFMAAYMDKTHPGHTAAVERMAGAYRVAYPEPVELSDGDRMSWDRGASSVNYEQSRRLVADAQRRTPGIRPDGRVAEVEISRLRADPAYFDGSHERHAEAVAAVTAAYQSAYPEPAAPSDSTGT